MTEGRVTERGAAGAEYLALIGVIAAMFAGLLVFRPHQVSRHAPIDVITPIARLLGRPLAPAPPVRPQGSRRPRVPAPRRRAPVKPPVMPLPEWWR